MNDVLLSVTTEQLSLVANFGILLCAAFALKNWKRELSGKTEVEDKRNFYRSVRLLSEKQTTLCRICLQSLIIQKLSLEKNGAAFPLDNYTKESINSYKNSVIESASQLIVEMQHSSFTPKNKQTENQARELIDICESFNDHADKILAMEREDVAKSEDDIEVISGLIKEIKEGHENIIEKEKTILRNYQ